MKETITTGVLAIGPGAMLGILALGLVVLYRGTATLNVAHGAMATLGAYAYKDLTVEAGMNAALATVLAALLVGVTGVVIQVLVMSRLRDVSALTRLIASTGILVVIQAGLQVRYGPFIDSVPSALPTWSVDLPGDITVGIDRVMLLGIAVGLTAVAWAVYRFTAFGVATAAIAENPTAGEAVGLRYQRLAVGNWFVAGVLAGLAGALLAPIMGLTLTGLSYLVVPALAAALVGSLGSFPLTLLGGIVIVVAQAVTTSRTDAQGAADVVPFAAIVLLMMWRGQSLPARGFKGLRLPALGTGQVRAWLVAASFAAAMVLVWQVLPGPWLESGLTSMLMAIVLLSVVVITGFAGQMSFAQLTLAGFGAYVAASLASDHGLAFPVVLVAGAAATAVLGALLALPAIRMRGESLAVVTLALSVVLFSVVLNRTEVVTVEPPALGGWDMNPILYPERYVTVVTVAFVGLALMVANLRRSASGRRLVAVRNNERAATALGINVGAAKASAFVFASFVAAVGGIFMAFRSPSVVFSTFDVFGSINVTGWAVIGGAGYVAGPLSGMWFANGGLGHQLFEGVFGEDFSYLPLIGGVALVFTIVQHPDGFASVFTAAYGKLSALGERARARSSQRAAEASRAAVMEGAVVDAGAGTPPDGGTGAGPAGTHAPNGAAGERHGLAIEGVSVAFGGVQALSDVDLLVRPGTVHGLIGANGAGKTTVLDVVSGFVRPSSGTIRIGDARLHELAPWRRSRAGLGRSFQSIELFEDLTVLDNLRAAADPRRPFGFVRDLFWPGKPRLSPLLRDCIRMLELDDCLHLPVGGLPYGRRQLVGIARALAAAPDVVMLDEPAAGLSELEMDEFGRLVRTIAVDRGVAVLLIEHDVNLVMRVSDEVTVLHFGEVIASGSPEAVRSSQAVVEAYLGDETLTDGTVDDASPADATPIERQVQGAS